MKLPYTLHCRRIVVEESDEVALMLANGSGSLGWEVKSHNLPLLHKHLSTSETDPLSNIAVVYRNYYYTLDIIAVVGLLLRPWHIYLLRRDFN